MEVVALIYVNQNEAWHVLINCNTIRTTVQVAKLRSGVGIPKEQSLRLSIKGSVETGGVSLVNGFGSEAVVHFQIKSLTLYHIQSNRTQVIYLGLFVFS